MEAVKVIAGGLIALGTFHIRWVINGWSTKATGIARVRGLSLWKVARPYHRWGVDARCDIWTILGAFMGAMIGMGVGWAFLDSVPVGMLFASVAAVINGWHYRIVTSILAVDRHAHDLLGRPVTPKNERGETTGGALR